MQGSQEAHDEDKASGISTESNTMKQVAKMASSVCKTLNFTYDLPDANLNNRMPVLDTKIWVGQEKREVGIPHELLDEQQRTMKVGSLQRVILY